MIKFNIPPYIEGTDKYVMEVMRSGEIAGDNVYTKKCEAILKEKLGTLKVHLTTSGTSALEMACLLADIGPGDEVILPSYTFSSTANAVVLFGGVPVFVDIRPDTMNIDVDKIEEAITDRTKAIMVVHYAGIGCEMEKVLDIAKRHGLLVIEDAAQVVNAVYHGKYLGTFGDIGCFSFHETKNYSMGEGGAILINNPAFLDRADIVREKGTNRTQFFNGQVDKYTWVDKGSSYLPSDILAAYLYPQLLIMDEMRQDRIDSFNMYYELLKPLKDEGKIDLPTVPEDCIHNGHMFYIKTRDLDERSRLQSFLKERGIASAFHYIPLHSAPEGLKAGRFVGEDVYTTREFERLLRLLMYYRIGEDNIRTVVQAIKEFYR
ncbi:MAG: dTDP-4-amino-4,6-dideoxygalactose transaminase [Erysipelotrichaceae bacterium]|nr:dTDP-4-amino-4,6-dideoxygalactose transaminase [Erysipelotrichaceae bacterium]